jgi:hypothetical protein
MVSRSFVHAALFGLFLLSLLTPQPDVFSASPVANDQDLQPEEREALQKAKDAEERLKIYLGIADGKLRDLLAYTRKLDKGNSAKAAAGFRAAVSGADESVAREQADVKNYRKLVLSLHKAVKKYNFTLVQALEKAAEDFRGYIQSAYEVSQRVQNGAELQIGRFQ